MALDGAKFICLSDAATEDAEATSTLPSTTVAGNVAGNGADATEAENDTVIKAKGRKFTVGYYMSCDYVLEDSRAEGVHCEIQCDAFGRVTIHNISDSNPISVNGQVITLKRPLLDGSRITILDRNFLWKFPKSVDVIATDSNKGEVTCNNYDQSITPQKVVAPEQAPNSCPDLKPHRKVDKRFTVHNFAYCINSDEEGNTSTDLPSINETDSVEKTTTSEEATQKKEEIEQTGTETVKREMLSSNNKPQGKIDDGKESNERRSITPEPQPHSNASTLSASTPILIITDTPKTNLINCTKNKENKSSEKNRRLISLCQQSDLVITSFSPRETGVRIEKSFTAVLKPIAATTPKSVYSTPKSLIYDSNYEGSRDFIDFSTPATSKKAFGARALAGNSSMHLIDLTTPNKLAPTSARHRTASATVKHNQTLPPNVKLSKTPLTYAKLDVGNDVEQGINALPVTPNVELPSTIDSDISTPQSAELVISVDGSSSDLSTHVIEISTEDSATPSISSPLRTNLTATKTPQRTVAAGQKSQLTATPQRTQAPSLIKRALLTSAKKNANPTNRASPARPNAPSTPTDRNIKLTKTTDATASTCSTPKSTSRIAIGSPSNVAAAQRRFLNVKPRRSLAAVAIGSLADSKSAITTSTPLNPRHTQTRNVTASAPRLSIVKRTSPLRGVRKSIGGVTLSSHISKTRRSVVSPKKRSPTTTVAQQVSKARKTLCQANANRNQIASRSRSLVAAAVSASSKTQTAFGEKTKTSNVPPHTIKRETDLSQTFTMMDDDSSKELQVEEDKLTDSVVEKSKNITFSPIKNDTSQAQQRVLNKTFSPEKPIIAGAVEIESEKAIPKHISESFAEEPKEKTLGAEVTKSTATNTTESQQQSLEISTINKDGDNAQQSQEVDSVEVIEGPLAADSKQSVNKNTDQLSTSDMPLVSETCDFVETGSPKHIGDSQGTADFLEEIEYVLNKSDELQQQLGGKDGHRASDSKAELEKLLTESDANMAELTTNVDHLERNTKITEQTDMDVEDDECLLTMSTAIELPTTSKIIFSVKSTLEEKEQQEEDKTSINLDVNQSTFETGASSDIDGVSMKSDVTIATIPSTPSEFDVPSFGASSMGTDANTERISATFDAQERINMPSNIEANKNVDDLTDEVSSDLINLKADHVEEPESTTSEIEELNVSKEERSDSKSSDSAKVDKFNNTDFVAEKGAAADEKEHIEDLDINIETQNIPQRVDEINQSGAAELNEVSQTEEVLIELTVESFVMDNKLTTACTDDTLEKSKIETEVPKINVCGSKECVKSNSEHVESQNVTALQVRAATTGECESEPIDVEETTGEEPINSDDEKENKKVTSTKPTNEPILTAVDADTKTTALEPKTPNLAGIRDMLRTPKQNSEIAHTTPRTIGLRNLMRTPKASTSAAATSVSIAEDDGVELPKTPLQIKKKTHTPQSTIENFTPRRSARRRASANPDLTPTRCSTPTLNTNTDVSKLSRTPRRRASASAEVSYTLQRINRRRPSLSLDNEEAVAAALTPRKRVGSSIRGKHTTTTLILECPEAEDMGAIIEEEPKDDVKGSNDSKQRILAGEDIERTELKPIAPCISDVIEDSICEEINAQKMPSEQLEDIVITEETKWEDEKQAKLNAERTEQAVEITDNAQTSIQTPIVIPFTKLKESDNDEEKVHIAVNPIVDAQEVYVTTTEATEKVKSQSKEDGCDDDIDKIEAKVLDKSDYEYGKEVEQESGDISTLVEQTKTPKTQRKSVRIAEDALGSPKTPVLVGMRELMQTPKDNNRTPKLIGVRDLMRTPKVAKGSVDEKEELLGLADLVKTPKTDTVRGKRFNKKGENINEEQEEPSTSAARTAFIGMRELLKTPKHTSTPQYRGMRELLRTPKACSTPQLGGLEELMQTPTRTKLNDKYDDDGDGEGLDQFFKTPRAKDMMIPGEPSSAILEPSTNSTLNIMTATTEYDLHSSNQRTLDDIYKTPVSRRLSNVDTLTGEDIETSSSTKKEEESEIIVPETPAQPTIATMSKRNIAATEAFDELDKCCTTVDSTTSQIVYTPKSQLPSNVRKASLLSPFSATDIITDLPKSDIQEWVDHLQQSDELDDGAEEGEVTVSASILNAASDATHDPIAPSVCETSNLTVNKDTTEQMLADMSAITTSDDPLLSSALKRADSSSYNTAADNRKETLRPATPNEAEISGIDLLDQTNESIFSEPLIVSDTESLHDDSQENDLVEQEKVIASERSTEIMSDAAENKSQDEEEFPIMFVESSDSEEDDVATKTPALTNKNNEGVADTVSVDLDDSNATESQQKTSATNSKTNVSDSTKASDIHIEFSNFQAHETIASQQIRASTPNRSNKSRTMQSAQARRRQSVGAEKQLGNITIDLTHEKSRLVLEKAHKARTADCIIEVDESIDEVVAFENVTQNDAKSTNLNENAVESNENATESVENAVGLDENAADSIENAVEWNENAAESMENTSELNENAAKSIENTTESDENSAQLSENVTEFNGSLGALNANAIELVPENQETTQLSTEKIREEFGNFQAHKTIASRGKRAATPDHGNKRNALKVTQAPRRLTLGAEKHLTDVSIDFLKEKSQLQQSKQLTEPIVESLQEVDDSIDEASVSKAKQSDTENMGALNVEAISVDNVVELEVEEDNAETESLTASSLAKATEISISTLSEEQTKQSEQKVEIVVEKITPEPELKVIEKVVTEPTTSKHIKKIEAAISTEQSTANNTSDAADDSTLEHQTNIALSKTEFNESDILDLTEEPPNDMPAVNTTQGIIFDLTEGEDEDTQVRNVESNKETESDEQSLEVTNDEPVGTPNQCSNNSRTECQSDAVTTNTQIKEQTGSDVPKAKNQEFLLMTSMDAEDDNGEISESSLNVAQARVEVIDELAAGSSKEVAHIVNIPNADSEDFEETYDPLEILEHVDSKLPENELDTIADKIIDESNVAAGIEGSIAVSTTLKIAQDKIEDNELELPENSNNSQMASAANTSEKVESETLANVEETKKLVEADSQESTKVTTQETFEEDLEPEQSSTEEVVDKTEETGETAEINIAVEKTNDLEEEKMERVMPELNIEKQETITTGNGTKLARETTENIEDPLKNCIKLDEENMCHIVEEETSKRPTYEDEKTTTSSVDSKQCSSNSSKAPLLTTISEQKSQEGTQIEVPVAMVSAMSENIPDILEEKPTITQATISISLEKTDKSENVGFISKEVASINQIKEKASTSKQSTDENRKATCESAIIVEDSEENVEESKLEDARKEVKVTETSNLEIVLTISANQTAVEEDESDEKTVIESRALVADVLPVQENQNVATETITTAVKEPVNEAKEKQEPAKRNARTTSHSKQSAYDNKDRNTKSTSEIGLTVEESEKEENSDDNAKIAEKNVKKSEHETDREEQSTNLKVTEKSNEEISTVSTETVGASNEVRKPSRTKQPLVVEEVKDNQDVDTETETAEVEEVGNGATSGQEKQQPLKRSVRKTSRSKQKVERKEDVEYKTTIVEEPTPTELVEETHIVGTESTIPPEIISEDQGSALATVKEEELVEATTSMPAKRRGRKPSRSKQTMDEKLSKDNKSLVEGPEENVENPSQVVDAHELLEQNSSVDAAVSGAGEAATLHVKATYEVCLVTGSEDGDTNASSDKTKNISDHEIVTATNVLDEAESTDISHKQEDEVHAQRPTRRTRKGSASSQCSLQDEDHLPTTTKRRAGRRRAATPVENSADEATAHDEAPTITKRRRGQAKARVEVSPHLEEIKEVLFDEVQLKEEADQCENKSLDTNIVEIKTEDKKETGNVSEKKQHDSVAVESLKESNDKRAHTPSELPRSVEPEKDVLEIQTETESSTISDEVKDVVAAELPANVTNMHEEEVKNLISEESTTSTKAPRRAGRRKPTVSESSQTSNSVEIIDTHVMQRTRRRRKPTTEDHDVDTGNAVEVGETPLEKAVDSKNEETPPTNKTRDMKAIEKETAEEQQTSSETLQTQTECSIVEKKGDASEIATISIESSDLKTESQKENIDVKEEEQASEQPTTTGRKRVYRRKKDHATEDHKQQMENDEHKDEEKADMAETNTKTTKVIEDTKNTPVAAESVGGRRGRRGAAAAATVAINENASAHKRGTPRGKTQQNAPQSQKSQRKGETKQTNTVEVQELDDEEPTDVKVVQQVVRRKRRGSVTAEGVEKEQQKEPEVESVVAKKVTKGVRKRRKSLQTEEAENMQTKEKQEGDDTTSSAIVESPKDDNEVTGVVVVSKAGDVGGDEPPKKRPVSRKRRDSSLDSSIHEVATAAVDGGDTKASAGNTSSASTTPNRSRNLPRRAVAAEERNYDESSDAEAQVELKRRIEKASLPKGNSSTTAAKKNKQQHSPTSKVGSSTTDAEMAMMSKAEDINTSARNTPILSTVLTTSRGGRQRKPTARVQQYLEEERAKAETPKKRLLLATGSETPSTSQAGATPARRTRKTSAIDVEKTEAQHTPARGRARNLKTLVATATETSEESRSEVDYTHSEHETTQSTTVVEEKEKTATSKVGKRTTTRRGKPNVSATIPNESELSEAQEAPTALVSAGRSGRAAKAAAAAALITDDQLSSGSHRKPRAISGKRARRGAHADTAASDDEHTDVEMKDGEDNKKSEKPTKNTTDDDVDVGRIPRAGRGGRRNKQNDALKIETSSVVAKQQTIVIDADDEHEEEDDDVVFVSSVDLENHDEEDDKPLAKVKKATKKRTATVGGSTASATESPAPKRVRRRGGAEKDADGTQPDTEAAADANTTRSRKIVRFDAESADSNVAVATTTRATRSRRK